jgi:hypothetical protein
MRKLFQILIAIAVTSPLLQGCALMQIDEQKELDPVAAAALAVRDGRNPAAEAGDPEEAQRRIHDAIAYRDVVPGMEMTDVRAALGDPMDVSTAGDPASGNERWDYSLGLTGRQSLGARRTLYFENGKLVGWEQRTSR